MKDAWTRLLRLLFALAVTVVAREGTAQTQQRVNVWYKLCTSEALTSLGVTVEPGSICQTIVDVRDNKTAVLIGQLAVRESIETGGYVLHLMLPLGSALQPGALVKIDDSAPIKLGYKMCDQAGCYAEAPVERSVIDRMKVGTKVAYLGIDVVGRALNIPLPLQDFAMTFEGPPTPFTKYSESQQKIDETIAQRGGVKPRVNTGGNAPGVMGSLGWYKLCPLVDAAKPANQPAATTQPAQKIKVCLTQAEMRDEATMLLTGRLGVRDVPGKPLPQLLVMLPVGVSIPDGAAVSIDGDSPITLVFTTCDQAGCYAEAPVRRDVIERLKKGVEANYSAITPAGEAVRVSVSLQGFAPAYEGEPLTAEAYGEEQKRLSEIIRGRLSEFQKHEAR